eukprot:Pgem_evm1s19528
MKFAKIKDTDITLPYINVNDEKLFIIKPIKMLIQWKGKINTHIKHYTTDERVMHEGQYYLYDKGILRAFHGCKYKEKREVYKQYTLKDLIYDDEDADDDDDEEDSDFEIIEPKTESKLPVEHHVGDEGVVNRVELMNQLNPLIQNLALIQSQMNSLTVSNEERYFGCTNGMIMRALNEPRPEGYTDEIPVNYQKKLRDVYQVEFANNYWPCNNERVRSPTLMFEDHHLDKKIFEKFMMILFDNFKLDSYLYEDLEKNLEFILQDCLDRSQVQEGSVIRYSIYVRNLYQFFREMYAILAYKRIPVSLECKLLYHIGYNLVAFDETYALYEGDESYNFDEDDINFEPGKDIDDDGQLTDQCKRDQVTKKTKTRLYGLVLGSNHHKKDFHGFGFRIPTWPQILDLVNKKNLDMYDDDERFLISLMFFAESDYKVPLSGQMFYIHEKEDSSIEYDKEFVHYFKEQKKVMVIPGHKYTKFYYSLKSTPFDLAAETKLIVTASKYEALLTKLNIVDTDNISMYRYNYAEYYNSLVSYTLYRFRQAKVSKHNYILYALHCNKSLYSLLKYNNYDCYY